jgi:hypothetical protein
LCHERRTCKPILALETVGLVLIAGRNHLAQLIFTGKLASKLTVGLDELLADLEQSVLGCDGTVGLNANQDLRDVGMSD